MSETTCIALLLLASASPCFAQTSNPAESQLGGLMAFEREIEAATARGDTAFLARADVKLKPPFLNAGKSEYSVWLVRVYRAKGRGWELVSHRTVAESAT